MIKPLTRQSAISRVEKGVRFLDKEFGRSSWLHSIHLESLDMSATASCVLGQTFPGHFSEGMDRLEELYGSDVDEARFGFNVRRSLLDGNHEQKQQHEFDMLAAVWSMKIKKYRAAISKAEKII